MLHTLDPSTMRLRDSNGNSVLHMCVVHEHLEMYDHICVRYEKHIENEGVKEDHIEHWRNEEHMTPLVLAAQLGLRETFEHILERSKRVQWSYGPVTCVVHPLSYFDIMVGSEEGALEHIVNEEHTEMLDSPRVSDLLNKKWDSFGGRYFYGKFKTSIAALTAFVVCTLYRKSPLHYTQMEISSAQGFVDTVSRLVNGCLLADHDALASTALLLLDLVVLSGALLKLKRELGELSQEGVSGAARVRVGTDNRWGQC